MKNFLFIVLISLFSLNVFSQGLNFKQKINVDDLIGYWQSEEESTQLFFWKDVNGKVQIQDICGSTGEPLTLIEFKINENSLYVKEVFVENNWITESIFTFIDKKTLKRIITGSGNGTVIYTKTK